MTLLKKNEPVPVYGDGMNIRDWIHVDDHSRAVESVLLRGRPGEIYNVGGGNERTNIEITKLLLVAMGQPSCASVRSAARRRPPVRHRRTKIRKELGIAPGVPFEEGIRETVRWYLKNEPWRARSNRESTSLSTNAGIARKAAPENCFPKAMPRRRLYFFLLLLWVALTFLFTSIPNLDIPEYIPFWDKGAHFAIYGGTGFLCALWRRESGFPAKRAALYAVLFVLAAGAVDETTSMDSRPLDGASGLAGGHPRRRDRRGFLPPSSPSLPFPDY